MNCCYKFIQYIYEYCNIFKCSKYKYKIINYLDDELLDPLLNINDDELNKREIENIDIHNLLN